MPTRSEKWIPWKLRGRTIGYVRGGTFYITRTVAGRRVRLSTGCVCAAAAMAEYERFEINPSAYVNRLGSRAIPLGRDPVRAAQLRNNHLARRYRITTEEYDRLMMLQGGKCAICGAQPTETKRGGLEVDHCHATRVIRGLLCGPCNRGIGNLGDSADLLRRATCYLESRSPGSATLGTDSRKGEPTRGLEPRTC